MRYVSICGTFCPKSYDVGQGKGDYDSHHIWVAFAVCHCVFITLIFLRLRGSETCQF